MKFDFCRSPDFGFEGWAFVPLFGSLEAGSSQGFRVVRVNVDTGRSADFLVINRPGPGRAGPCRPVEVLFSPDGKVMYLLDYGELFAYGGMIVPTAGSGAVWKIWSI